MTALSTIIAQASVPPTVTTDSINDIFANNLAVMTQSFGEAQAAGSEILIALATIQLLAFFYVAMFKASESILQEFVQQIILLFMVMVVTLGWGKIANGTMGYIVGAAGGAGGAGGQVTALNPAHIASQGMDKVSVIFSEEATEKIINSNTGLFGYADDPPAAPGGGSPQDTSFFDGASPSAAIDKAISGLEGLALELAVLLTYIGLALLIVFVHFYVALQIFVVTISFYITVSITQLLIPFAVNKHTSPIATSAFNSVVAKGVEVGVMVMILGMFGNTIAGLQLDATPTLYELLALLLGVCTLAFMISRSNQIAAGIFSAGGAGIDVGGMMMAASASLAQTAVSAASGGVSAAANQLSGGGGGTEAVMAPLDPTGGAASGAGGVGDAADAVPGPAGQQETAPASVGGEASSSSEPGAAGQQEAAQGPLPGEHPEVTAKDLSAGSNEGGSGE
jgi:hypothetical protein